MILKFKTKTLRYNIRAVLESQSGRYVYTRVAYGENGVLAVWLKAEFLGQVGLPVLF